ncbi:helicase-exonuclease AddAB subunit AddA [Ruminococcus flavefaciens]|uniref:DNA 3'-5' helicase n=1 Tax=Ruminococcus flavefaciens TaxID=1265 RepID=A0A1M7H2R9_RUMFL|nr:helicase-exonuclease AddAB subunit AddA [Ruminococcus flavefaciens]SHM22770.1 DNA helicase/exodeoxyribonuclease V, subunit A [Ruminococcus flavefaciens]
MGWTQQQQNAIDARDTSLIVSAAAGSGKTAVLTERLIKLIADKDSGVRADRMIVVTFTNDAASELKKRLDVKLRELINDRPDDKHLLKQQILLQSARISTINSFCFDLIRDNMSETGITSGFAVLDDSDNKVLRARAMDELINYYSQNEYEKISFMYDRFCIKDEKRLIEVIERADSFLSSVAFRDKWLDKAVDMYKADFKESFYFKSLMSAMISELEKAQKAADDNIGLISRIFPDMSSAAAEKSCALAEDDYDKIADLLAVFRCSRLPDESESAKALDFSDLVRVGKTPHDKALREIYKKKRDIIKKTAAKVINSVLSVESDYRECGEVTVVLAEMLKKYQELIWEKKCEKNGLSFDDGERLALEILADTDDNGNIVRSEIAERIVEYYDIIMIDEYQDSNNKQDLIFKLISKDFRTDENHEPLYGSNVFLVGDVKQSIYRFRLANPKNFINTLHRSESYSPDNDCKNQAISLNKNFRSSPQVIDFVNYVFGQIMSEKCGDINYTDNEKLYFGAEQYSDNNSSHRLTHFAFINDDASEEDEDEKINAEVVYTAGKIADMIRSGVSVTDKDGSERPCRPCDFCILVRNNKYINIYAEQLNKNGIPAKGSEESGYLKAREIAVLIDLLRVISNPIQDIPLAAVMTSPMYMFSIEDIAVIRSYDKKRALFPIIRGIADGEYPECDDMFLRERCMDFLESIDAFRLDSVTMTIGELIGEIYDSTDFISVMQLYSDGEKKRANLRALIQYAQNYESTAAFDGSGGLNGFLRHLDRVMDNGDYAQGKVASSSGDYVSVLTMHRSKGLEFPFVFIAETSVNFQFDSKTVMCSPDGRIGYVLYDPILYRKYKTFQQVMLSAEEERDTRSEEMRLLYVALTRAKQQLFINLKCGEKALKRVNSITESCILHNGDIRESVSEAKSFSDWIWSSMIRDELFAEVAEHYEIENVDANSRLRNDKKLFEFEFVDSIDVSDTEQAEEADEAIPDEKTISDMKEIISYKYDKTLSETPAKLSVTEITKKLKNSNEIFDFKLKRPKFKSAGSRLSGAERGTAIHTFFQYCNFDNAINDTSAEIKNVMNKGYISSPEAESINIENVKAFFESSLYKRICAAISYVREKKFMVAVSQLDTDNEALEKLKHSDGMIKGIIDLMFEEKDGIVIVDYKSDRGVSLEKLRERYSMQLKLYKAAIELTTGKKVKEAFLYSFELKKYAAVEI